MTSQGVVTVNSVQREQQFYLRECLRKEELDLTPSFPNFFSSRLSPHGDLEFPYLYLSSLPSGGDSGQCFLSYIFSHTSGFSSCIGNAKNRAKI